MLYKKSIIEELSKIENLVFVGGASEYLQDVKDSLNDIDIVIINENDLRNIGYLHKFKMNLFFGLSGERGVILKNNILIDIFIENSLPEYVIVNEKYKCQAIDSMIELREKTLNMEHMENLPKNITDKIKFNLNRLIEWKQLQ